MVAGYSPADLRVEVSYVWPQAEYTPPVIYSRETREQLVYRIDAKPISYQPYRLHPGAWEGRFLNFANPR